MAAPVILLGPQRLQPILKFAVADLDARIGGRGKIAVVTAGWEERELEIQELDEHVGGRVANLEIYHRVEDAFRRDPELLAAMRERHGALRELAELYRLRLGHGLAAVRELQARGGTQTLLEPERAAAIEAVRALDAEHLRRVAALDAEFDARTRPAQRKAVVHHKRELAQVLAQCSLLAIAGGHVGALLYRLRLFDVLGLHGDRPVIAWSAGAMVCSERIVLFHDSPPQGAGDAEVYEAGLGLVPGVVALPHARARLMLDDRARVSLFARRFAPARAFALDLRTRLDWIDGELRAHAGTATLGLDGSVGETAA